MVENQRDNKRRKAKKNHRGKLTAHNESLCCIRTMGFQTAVLLLCLGGKLAVFSEVRSERVAGLLQLLKQRETANLVRLG